MPPRRRDQPGGRAEMEEVVDAVARQLVATGGSWPALSGEVSEGGVAPAIKEPDDAEPAPSQRRLWLRDLREKLLSSSHY